MFELIRWVYSFPIYPICFAYCVWRIQKRMEKTSLDGIIGTNPAFETYGALIFAPAFVVSDLVSRGYNYLKSL